MAFGHRCRCCGPAGPGPIGRCSSLRTLDASNSIRPAGQTSIVTNEEGLMWLAGQSTSGTTTTIDFRGSFRRCDSYNGGPPQCFEAPGLFSVKFYDTPRVVSTDPLIVSRADWGVVVPAASPYRVVTFTWDENGMSFQSREDRGPGSVNIKNYSVSLSRGNVAGGGAGRPSNTYPPPIPAGCGGSALGSLRGPTRGRLITT